MNSPISFLISKLFAFCLDVFKNSQFINFIVFCCLYFFIFFTIILGTFFTFYEDATSKFIVLFLSIFFDTSSNASFHFNGEGAALIKYYLSILFILGIFQELIFIILKKIFKKDFRDRLKKSKRISFFILITACLIIEIAASFFLKEPSMFFIGAGSFVALLIFYFWYRLVAKIVDKIQSILNKTQTDFA